MIHRSFILLFILFVASRCFSQDIITTKKGEDILAKITEVGKTDIKYKLFDNQTGPVYTLLKADILMVRYENGSKDIFLDESKNNDVSPSPEAPVTPRDRLLPKGQEDPKLFYAGKAEKYRRRKNTGAALTILGGVLFVAGVVTLSNVTTTTTSYGTSTSGNPGGGALAFLAGAAGLGVGIPFWIVGAHNVKKYNRKLEGVSFRINVTPQGKGLGLTYRF